MNDRISKFPALWPKWVQILVAPLVILSLNMLFHFLCGWPFHIKPIVKISGWVCKFGGVYYAITYRVLPYFLITVLKLAFLLAIVWKYRTEFLKIVFSCSILLDIVALVTFFIDYEVVKVKNMSWLFSLSDEYQFSHYFVGNIYLIPAVILLVKVWWWRKVYYVFKCKRPIQRSGVSIKNRSSTFVYFTLEAFSMTKFVNRHS